MIHSLSGGVLADNGIYDFAKVRVGETPMWFLAPFPVSAGDEVLVPLGHGTAQGKVERTERCSRQTAPIPMKHAKEILAVLRENS